LIKELVEILKQNIKNVVEENKENKNLKENKETNDNLNSNTNPFSKVENRSNNRYKVNSSNEYDDKFDKSHSEKSYNDNMEQYNDSYHDSNDSRDIPRSEIKQNKEKEVPKSQEKLKSSNDKKLINEYDYEEDSYDSHDYVKKKALFYVLFIKLI